MAGGKDSQPAKAEVEPGGSDKTESPSQPLQEQEWVKAILLQQPQNQQQLAQRSAVMTAMEQLQHLNAKEVKGDVAGSSATTTGDKELTRWQKLPYCPYSASNFYPTRPSTLESRMPQFYDLYGDKTFDSLNRKSSSSLKYEQLILAPALAYLYNAVQFSDDTLEMLEHQDTQHVSALKIERRVYKSHNTVMGATWQFTADHRH
ncbi:hypothetical protein CYMTET_9964 [Cymbomonas tetramitiformis]|uniref:Uncharacterized protein n=1 Tax=Cymbomonas tetramitiformis TaxID=36881 RepID=A0AAE0GQ27_9CHLO|nr:hypothetical protein CYMTET_9964 [Cymbomonas tetramitiformis]